MLRSRLVRVLVIVAVALAVPAATATAAPVASAPSVRQITGYLPDSSSFLIEVPSNWNGTLALHSHGYAAPGSPNPAQDVSDPTTRGWLLAHGYALAGSSYPKTGWSVGDALPAQVATLNKFRSLVGAPHRTIAWGGSLGGIITAGLVQRYPAQFDAAMPICGVVAGGVGSWNAILDAQFVFKTLLAAQSGLQLVNIRNASGNLAAAEQILAAAQATPQGRAHRLRRGDVRHPGMVRPRFAQAGTR